MANDDKKKQLVNFLDKKASGCDDGQPLTR
jgi:hypothetical protein